MFVMLPDVHFLFSPACGCSAYPWLGDGIVFSDSDKQCNKAHSKAWDSGLCSVCTSLVLRMAIRAIFRYSD